MLHSSFRCSLARGLSSSAMPVDQSGNIEDRNCHWNVPIRIFGYTGYFQSLLSFLLCHVKKLHGVADSAFLSENGG